MTLIAHLMLEDHRIGLLFATVRPPYTSVCPFILGRGSAANDCYYTASIYAPLLKCLSPGWIVVVFGFIVCGLYVKQNYVIIGAGAAIEAVDEDDDDGDCGSKLHNPNKIIPTFIW